MTLLACTICGLAGSADNTYAYAAMSIVLSAVPLGIIGGIVIWIRRASARDSVNPVPHIDLGPIQLEQPERVLDGVVPPTLHL